MAVRALTTARQVHRESGSDLMARGLGFLSLMLGAAELVGARRLSRMLGLRGQENFIRLCGTREILQGTAILVARDPTPWVWVRVAGDALDFGTLAAEHYMGDRSKRLNMMIAFGAVLGITALDIMNARTLSRENRQPWSTAIDFSRRSGFSATASGSRHGRPRRHSRASATQPAEAM